MELNKRSLDRLNGVHPDLVKVIKRAAELVGDDADNYFVVTCGLRTIEEQKVLVAKGLSKTMNSRHLTGHAVDLASWIDADKDKVVDADEISWKFPKYQKINETVQQAAKELGITVKWGGTFVGFVDGPHFELNPVNYPFKK